jgi:hypothetical protein
MGWVTHVPAQPEMTTTTKRTRKNRMMDSFMTSLLSQNRMVKR